jgi:hypothetical protein
MKRAQNFFLANTGAERVFLIRPTIAYRIRSANTIRMTIHFAPSNLFTIGTPLETISHTPGKILSSVT